MSLNPRSIVSISSLHRYDSDSRIGRNWSYVLNLVMPHFVNTLNDADIIDSQISFLKQTKSLDELK